MDPTQSALLTEIRRLADATGLVSELPLFDLTDGSSEKLKDLLEALEEAGYVRREPSDCVRLTPAGLAAAQA